MNRYAASFFSLLLALIHMVALALLVFAIVNFDEFNYALLDLFPYSSHLGLPALILFVICYSILMGLITMIANISDQANFQSDVLEKSFYQIRDIETNLSKLLENSKTESSKMNDSNTQL